MPEDEQPYAGLLAVLGSAVAATVAVFGLFSSVLADLVPPFEDSPQTVGFVHVGSLVVLLALSLVIRGRLTNAHGRTLASVSVGLLVISGILFIYLHDLTRTYVYRYPPSDTTTETQSRHIRGELNTRGATLVGAGTVDQAVFRAGGPNHVRANGTLWDNDSRNAVVRKLEYVYIVFIAFTITALFVGLLTVVHFRNSEKQRSASRVRAKSG